MKDLNSCICKCGSISCRNIHVRSFKNEIPKNNDHFIYSKLHHKSLQVANSKSIIIDKCCENNLHFHCSKCHDKFSIIQSQASKSRFLFGFSSDCLTHLDSFVSDKIVVIPDFPIVLRSFVFLSNQQSKENNNFIKNTNQYNHSLENSVDDEDDIEYDEEIMFGKDHTNLIVGKYNEVSIFSF